MSLFDKLVTKLTKTPGESEKKAEAAEETVITEEQAVQSEAEEVLRQEPAEEEAAEKPDGAPADGSSPEKDAIPDVVDIMTVRKEILVVDSDEKSEKDLAQILNGEYDLVLASDGEEALKVLRERKNTVSLILVDVMMNGRRGMDILQSIKADKDFKDIPAMAFTSDRDSEIKSIGLGALDFIPKPLPDPFIVRTRINRCAELAESREIISSTKTDRQSGLFNEGYFKHYVDIFDRYHPNAAMDSIFAVIGNFRTINEHYGKRFARSAIQTAAAAIKDVSEKLGGACCRDSEDSFLIYIPHTEDHNALLRKITAIIEEDASLAGKLRLCLGVYAERGKRIPSERRFELAEIAAQTVLNSYTESVGIYDAKMQERALFKEQILSEFMPSLSKDRFKIYFQPKFDIRGDSPILYSAEALVRWDHPQLGMLGPGAFIELLEENGLITQLDRYVWSRAAAEIRRWKDEFGFSVPVSVNISQIDMLLPLLKDIFKEILKQYSLTENDFILEITESAYNNDGDQILSAARELQGMGLGMRIEVGSFGAGYSSIGTLSHMPIDALKIDMDFVHNSLGDKKDMSMIELIIDIADYLHVPVVAEGVETEEQYLLLKALGCDLVQGFYFSKPVPKEEFEHFIREACEDKNAPVMAESKGNYVSISKALTGEYEGIFYIDIRTDHYMLFYSGTGSALRIQTGGKDFYADIDETVLSLVVEEDKERIAKLLSKKELMSWVTSDKPLSTQFRHVDEGLYTLETIHTRNQDDHHVVIGIRRSVNT
ncbi:MAG: EAL domain-containing protein [Oscillospiraceae bacterium]|nr:EAL domain-containing protein [Oscillospiraceae bacterium]